MPLSHVGISVGDIERSRNFYAAALAPLGIGISEQIPASESEKGGAAIGFGTPGEPGFFWIGDKAAVGEGTHIAFDAATREQVDAFHRAAIEAGGRDNGAPGLRPNYGPNYYAAFVFDPDDVNVEAVCDRAE